jgi:uncharacterized protein YycO
MVMKMKRFDLTPIYILMISSLFFLVVVPVVHASRYHQDETSSIAVLVQPGDIIFCYSQSMDPIIPGYWTHIAIFVGFDNYGRGWAIESAKGGVQYLRTGKLLARGYEDLALGRVNADSSQIYMALTFAQEQLGKPYDFQWYSKQVYGSSYYCSELAWASYYVAGVDIDENPGWSPKYANGVAPQEVFDDADVSVIWSSPK